MLGELVVTKLGLIVHFLVVLMFRDDHYTSSRACSFLDLSKPKLGIPKFFLCPYNIILVGTRHCRFYIIPVRNRNQMIFCGTGNLAPVLARERYLFQRTASGCNKNRHTSASLMPAHATTY
jgi:hypothetical protein